MLAKLKETCNYRNLNGQWLTVQEIHGDRVTCLVETPDLGVISADFKLDEISELRSTSPKNLTESHKTTVLNE